MFNITDKKFENLEEVVDFFRNKQPHEFHVPNIFLNTGKIKIEADDLDTEDIRRMKIYLEDLFISLTPITLEEFANRFFYYLEKMYGIVVDRIRFQDYSIDFYVSAIGKKEQDDADFPITVVRFAMNHDIRTNNGFSILVLNLVKTTTKLVLRYENRYLFKFSIVPSKDKKDFEIVDSLFEDNLVHIVADAILSKYYNDESFYNYYDKNGNLIENTLQRPFLCLRLIELIESIKEEQDLDVAFGKMHYSYIRDIEKSEEGKLLELKATSFRKAPEYQRHIIFYRDRIVFKTSLLSFIGIPHPDGDGTYLEGHGTLIDNIGDGHSFFEIEYKSYRTDDFEKFINDFLYRLYILFETSNRCIKNLDDSLKHVPSLKAFKEIVSKRNLKKTMKMIKKYHTKEKKNEEKKK